MERYQAAIKEIAYYLPDKICDNDSLVKHLNLEWSAEEIFKKTGIDTRHIAKDDECASDLGVQAACKLFASGACQPNDIDFLLFCTQSPDYFLPATACIMHEKLGLRKSCGAFDYNQGCSGFVYGLALAKGLIETGIANNILLITAETYSKYINDQDRSTRTIFGDGAAATLITAVKRDSEYIGSMVFGTDGTGAENLIVPAGGMRLPISSTNMVEDIDKDGNVRSKANLYMNGPEIFNFTLQVVPKTVREILQKANISIDKIDFFIFHQANKFMLDHLQKKLKITEDKFWSDMSECGNTVSSSIPIAMKMALDNSKIKSDDYIMLVGFGVGYSWAACIIRML
jgi:3-oxoacyl-[acyl-carrier-protein] synthase-3